MERYNSTQRRKILEAAIAVFADKGLEGATIRLVGLKAGINSALIYYYFENKQKLFEEAIRMVVGDFLLMLDRHKTKLANARDRVGFLVNGIFDYYATRRDRMRLMIVVFSLHCDLLAEILRGFIMDQKVTPLSVLREGIRRGELKPLTPIQLWWSLLGMCMFTLQAQEIASRLDKDKIPWALPPVRERKKQIIELLLSGMAVS